MRRLARPYNMKDLACPGLQPPGRIPCHGPSLNTSLSRLSLNWRQNESVRDDNASKRRSERMVIYRRCGTIRVCVEFHNDTQARGDSVSVLSTWHNTYAAEPILRHNNSESEKRGCTSLLHDRRCFTVESIVRRSHTRQLVLHLTLRPQQRGRDLHTCTKEQATEHEAPKQFVTFCEWHS
jgi:hypothetical protein